VPGPGIDLKIKESDNLVAAVVTVEAGRMKPKESTRSPLGSLAVQEPGGSRAFLTACAVIVIAAAVVRIAACMNGLWLDEIWTLTLLRTISSPLEIFTRLKVDNNHYLNTLYMYFFRDHGNWPGFRALSVVTGLGAVVLAGLICRRDSRRSALTAMLLMACSYVMILYSSEARGYMPMVFFCLLGFLLLRRYLDKGGWWPALAFSACAILGFLSQLLFLHFYLAALAWTAVRLWQNRRSVGGFILNLLRCHAVPLAFAAVLYFTQIRGMAVGGGVGAYTDRSVLEMFAWALGWTLSPPSDERWKLLAAVLAIYVLGVGLSRLRRQGDELVFFAAAIVVVPLMFMLAWPVVPYVRYYLVPFVFMLLLLAKVLAQLGERKGVGKAAYALAIVALLVANGLQTATLLRVGRGQKIEALDYMARNSRLQAITVGGDHNFRVATELSFYTGGFYKGRQVVYYETPSWPRQGPEWIIVQTEADAPRSNILKEIGDINNNGYKLAAEFPCAELSGLRWYLYHNNNYGQ
jgi:hypothetical protein